MNVKQLALFGEDGKPKRICPRCGKVLHLVAVLERDKQRLYQFKGCKCFNLQGYSESIR